MSEYYQTRAFYHNGPLETIPFDHPVTDLYKSLQAAFTKDPSAVQTDPSPYYAQHWYFKSPTGQVIRSVQQFYTEFVQPMVAPFARFKRQSDWLVIYEISEGQWQMVEGVTNFFDFDANGEVEDWSRGNRDREGKKWGLEVPAVYRFGFEGEGEDVRMSWQETVMDIGILKDKVAERKNGGK